MDSSDPSVLSPPQQPQATESNVNTEPKTLWIGQLQQNWDEAYVSSLFEVVAKPVAIKIMRYHNTALGYAFVDFASHEDAQNALNTLNNQRIPGTNQTFRLNWGAGNNRRSFGAPNEFSLFVGDLPTEVTDTILFDAFASNFPSCTAAKVVIDGYTCASKGYGFVRFSDRGQCDAAIATMNGMTIAGRQVRVSHATAPTRRHVPYHGSMPNQAPIANIPVTYPYMPAFSPTGADVRGVFRNSASNQMGANQWRSDVGGAPLSVSSSGRNSEDSLSPEISSISSGMQFPEVASLNSSFTMGNGNSENTTVFVGNLDPAVTEPQLQQHFHGFGNIVQVKIPPNRGCGFVKYDSHESAERALLQLNGSVLCNQRIRLDWGKANANRQQAAMMAAAAAVDPAMSGYTTAYNPYMVSPWQNQAYYYTRYGASYVVTTPQTMLQAGMRYPQDGYIQGAIPLMTTQHMAMDGIQTPSGLDENGGLADYNTVNSAIAAQQQHGQNSTLAWNGVVQ